MLKSLKNAIVFAVVLLPVRFVVSMMSYKTIRRAEAHYMHCHVAPGKPMECHCPESVIYG